MVCQIKKNINATTTQFELSNKRLFKDVPELNELVGKRGDFLDNNVETIKLLMDDADSWFNKIDIDDRKIILDNMKDALNSAEKDSLFGEALWNRVQNNLDNLDKSYGKGTGKEVREYVKELKDPFEKRDYNFGLILRSLNPETHFKGIGNKLNGSLTYEFMTKFGQSNDKLLRADIKNNALQYMNDKQADQFVKDFMGDALGNGKFFKFISGLKGAYRFLKYGPLGIASGVTLLNNSVLLGTGMMMSKRRGLESLMSSEALEGLVKDLNFLKSEDRAGTISMAIDSIEGQNWFNQTLDKFHKLLPDGTKFKEITETVNKGGRHSLYDLAAEGYIKKMSIAQSLSKNGFGVGNVDEFYRLAKSGELDPKVLYKVKADAQIFMSDFFTSGSLTGLNRNKFSKFWMFNTLQNYVINRTDEVRSSVRKAALDFKGGKIKTRGEFTEYLATENQELKGLLNNVLYSAKAAYYVDTIVNDKEDNHGNYRKYIIDTSDYLSSIPASWFMRILTAPMAGINKYYDYTAATGKKEEFLEGASVAGLEMVAKTMQSFFKEGALLKTLADTVVVYRKTGDLDFTNEVLGADLNKITNGLGRFMLIPGLETYDLKPIDQSDDFYLQTIMAYHQGNESMKKAYDLRDIATVDSMLNDTNGFLSRMLNYFPIIGETINLASGKGGFTFNEAKYSVFKQLVENNPTMQKIRAGEFPDEILNDSKILNRLYGDLTSFNYPRIAYAGNGKHEFTYGKNAMKEEVFVENLLKKNGMTLEQFDKYLVGGAGGSTEKLGLMKVMAAAEANEPGSSKIVISYLANKDAYNKGAFKTGTKKEDSDAIKAEAVKNRYPMLYFADKTSRYKLGQEAMEMIEPDIFKNITKDDEFKGFVNSLAFVDMVMRSEAKKGDIDAKYIKNIFNVVPKYVKSKEARLAIANQALDSISGLHNATHSQKQTMKTGVLAANIDVYDEIKQDETASILYKDDLEKFEDITRGVMDNLNMVGSTQAVKDMSTQAGYQYYGANGKDREPSKYAAGNQAVQEGLKDKFQKVMKPTSTPRNTYTPKANTYQSRRQTPLSPKEYKIYVKFYNKIYEAITANLVKTKGRRYPAELLDELKFEGRRTASRTIKDPEGLKFKRPRRKRVTTSVLPGLPGG